MDALMTRAEIVDRTGLNASYLRQIYGEMPKPRRKIGANLLYARDDIEAWLKARAVRIRRNRRNRQRRK